MSSSMNKYWIPHQDIHRKVITQELQYYLGPQATVRPYTLEPNGYPLLMNSNVGRGWIPHHHSRILPDRCWSLLEQIDDICRKSKDLWDRQAAAKVQQNPEKLLKRPLHQPVIVSRGSSRDSHRRYHDRRRQDED
ncbi:unnamed protein product [Fusarium fujikuroi]|uniref:Uncharacterized protein n=1 Tax=Fusarium fujikuroi TaxID=5127 RepID=A0A9Q9RGV6_FUSFU|nr:unnamed protein product [Fusarium fujikuroi]VTT71695.1 unnamed protein product [Fusarium fujikuroi]VZI16923.1 unnamed protein product [Fusarium fujikuroi]